MNETGPVLVEDHGAVRVVTLHRPQVRNAIDWPMRVAFAEALEQADGDPRVRAVVITGAGPAFCSGGDISTMGRLPRAAAVERAQAGQRMVRAIWATPKPVLAAVEGSAYGAGVALAAACDRVVAAEDTTWATTFTRVGLAGDLGAYASLPARMGPARARQMLLLGRPLDGRAALHQGLVDELVAPGTALETALADAEQLAAGPAAALGVIKSLLSGEPRHPLAVLELEVRHQVALWESPDFAEGVAAFRERRTPDFGAD
ncbi:enoyl-CoA hydratase/isomerase family protein [Nocardioides pantholopis]|uniref:enoyl-CoA hydratase/isomerase family protein n=1 Tax=Nocardioides pantholopis TaxID=2483798 RepID=UPI000FDC97DF|nr:enoyl-CoA hydratase/isomerase family protein [Nocardioides pantholopis]